MDSTKVANNVNCVQPFVSDVLDVSVLEPAGCSFNVVTVSCEDEFKDQPNSKIFRTCYIQPGNGPLTPGDEPLFVIYGKNQNCAVVFNTENN